MEKTLKASYLSQVKTNMGILKAIDGANDVLQTRGYTYAQGRDALDIIIKGVTWV